MKSMLVSRKDSDAFAAVFRGKDLPLPLRCAPLDLVEESRTDMRAVDSHNSSALRALARFRRDESVNRMTGHVRAAAVVSACCVVVLLIAASGHATPGSVVEKLVAPSSDVEVLGATTATPEFQPSPIWRAFMPEERELIAQRGGASASGTGTVAPSTQNPPGFYVPVRPDYEGRTFTIRGTVFTSNEDLLSLSLGYNRHPIFDLEFGVWANPLWCSDFIDRCRPGKQITAWGMFLQYGISRQLADQRGIRRRPWSFEVPFHLEFRYLNGDNISTVLWGVHIGIEFVRWFKPSTGLALKLTAGSPFVDMRSWNLQSLQLNFRGSIGITF